MTNKEVKKLQRFIEDYTGLPLNYNIDIYAACLEDLFNGYSLKSIKKSVRDPETELVFKTDHQTDTNKHNESFYPRE